MWKEELRNRVTFRHAEMGHLVERYTTNERLRSLSFQQAGGKFVTKDSFQAEHDGFCQRTNVIAGIILPLLPSVFANVTQVLISLETFLLRVAMLPDVRILARWDQNLQVW